MTFRKGDPKPIGSGLKKGQKIKRTLAEDACLKAGIDPFQIMAEIAANPAHPDRFPATKELCCYLQAKMQAVQVAIDPESNEIKVIIEDYGQKK